MRRACEWQRHASCVRSDLLAFLGSWLPPHITHILTAHYNAYVNFFSRRDFQKTAFAIGPVRVQFVYASSRDVRCPKNRAVGRKRLSKAISLSKTRVMLSNIVRELEES